MRVLCLLEVLTSSQWSFWAHEAAFRGVGIQIVAGKRWCPLYRCPEVVGSRALVVKQASAIVHARCGVPRGKIPSRLIAGHFGVCDWVVLQFEQNADQWTGINCTGQGKSVVRWGEKGFVAANRVNCFWADLQTSWSDDVTKVIYTFHEELAFIDLQCYPSVIQ